MKFLLYTILLSVFYPFVIGNVNRTNVFHAIVYGGVSTICFDPSIVENQELYNISYYGTEYTIQGIDKTICITTRNDQMDVIMLYGYKGPGVAPYCNDTFENRYQHNGFSAVVYSGITNRSFG